MSDSRIEILAPNGSATALFSWFTENMKMLERAALFGRQAGPNQPNRFRRHYRRVFVVFALIAYVVFTLHLRQTCVIKHGQSSQSQQYSDCGNSTLGFEKVVVVSTGPSWRLDGLIEAANRTGIDVEVPAQPKWTTREVDIFRRVALAPNSEVPSKKGRGLAQCWLGHLNVIREILIRGWSTSLVMEDDVDWDIMIKRQLAFVAPMIKKVTISEDPAPYGSGWDLMWLGHCGEATPASGHVLSQIDESLPESPIYRRYDGSYSYFPPQLRIVHHTYAPICTYAYALTYSGASTIYQLALGGKEHTITAGLYDYCKNGHLRCVSVNPELFHHHKKAGVSTSQIAVVEGWDTMAKAGDITYTANIRHSARCNSRSKDLVTCQDPMAE